MSDGLVCPDCHQRLRGYDKISGLNMGWRCFTCWRLEMKAQDNRRTDEYLVRRMREEGEL